MKCIQNVSTEEIVKVSDEQADRQVNSGKWKFVPRSAWKVIRDKGMTPEQIKARHEKIHTPKIRKQKEVPNLT